MTDPLPGPAPVCPVCSYPWAQADRVCSGCGADRGRWTASDEQEWSDRRACGPDHPDSWAALLAAPPQPGEHCGCRWCSAGEALAVPDLPDSHRETD